MFCSYLYFTSFLPTNSWSIHLIHFPPLPRPSTMLNQYPMGRRHSGETVAVNSNMNNHINTDYNATKNGEEYKCTTGTTDGRLDLISTNESKTGPGDVLNVPAEGELDRALTSSHLNMLAFSGSVGTGLIIGSGTSLHNGEPPLLHCKIDLKAHELYRWSSIACDRVHTPRDKCLGHCDSSGRDGRAISDEKRICGLRHKIRGSSSWVILFEHVQPWYFSD
jgi:hypothetical protein